MSSSRRYLAFGALAFAFAFASVALSAPTGDFYAVLPGIGCEEDASRTYPGYGLNDCLKECAKRGCQAFIFGDHPPKSVMETLGLPPDSLMVRGWCKVYDAPCTYRDGLAAETLFLP